MGYVMLHCQSSKKNLNTKCLTEAELIGASEYVTFNLWMFMFMEAKGYAIKKNIILQDNKRTIRMANNGRDVCT